MVQGKIWGSTQKIFHYGNVEAHLIRVKAGYACSLHRHVHRHNGFLVISGELAIEAHKNDYDLVDRTVLLPGQQTFCKPGEYHRFLARVDAVAIEWYWIELSRDDIERKDHGHEAGVAELFNAFGGVESLSKVVGGQANISGEEQSFAQYGID